MEQLQSKEYDLPHLSPEEEDDMIFNALFGALDDLHMEYVAGEAERRLQDEEIMAAVQGVYTAGAEYTNSDLGKTMQLFSEFEARLGAMQGMCDHDHMMAQTFGFNADMPNVFGAPTENHHHSHEDEDDPKNRKKKKKKRLAH